ncbi:MAG: hypothetical protein ACE5O2_15470, partial [Armatimonadota bacterium]
MINSSRTTRTGVFSSGTMIPPPSLGSTMISPFAQTALVSSALSNTAPALRISVASSHGRSAIRR